MCRPRERARGGSSRWIYRCRRRPGRDYWPRQAPNRTRKKGLVLPSCVCACACVCARARGCVTGSVCACVRVRAYVLLYMCTCDCGRPGQCSSPLPQGRHRIPLPSGGYVLLVIRINKRERERETRHTLVCFATGVPIGVFLPFGMPCRRDTAHQRFSARVHPRWIHSLWVICEPC